MLSRHFRKHSDAYERQAFLGPPENTRDHVMAASRSLAAGDWAACYELLAGLPVWQLVAGADSAEKIKAVLKEQIREAALRTFMFAYSPHYETISLKFLCDKFDLPSQQVHSLVSKMMIGRELSAVWDGLTTIKINRVENSRLQTLALNYCEKVAQLVDSNEKLLDARSGVYGFSDRDFSAHNWRDAGRASGRNRAPHARMGGRGGSGMRRVGGRGGGRGGGGGGRGGGRGGGQKQWN